MNDNRIEGVPDDPPLVLLSSRSLTRFFDYEVLSGPITPLGLACLYLGHDTHLWNYEDL